MDSEQGQKPGLPPGWAEVLDRVLQALETAAAEATAREAAIEPDAGSDADAWRARLEQVAAAPGASPGQGSGAIAAAGEADAALADAAAALEAWLASWAAARAKLTAWGIHTT